MYLLTAVLYCFLAIVLILTYLSQAPEAEGETWATNVDADADADVDVDAVAACSGQRRLVSFIRTE